MGPWTIPEFWCGVIAAELLNLGLLIVVGVYMHYRKQGSASAA